MEMKQQNPLVLLVEEYAREKQLTCTQAALSLMSRLIEGDPEGPTPRSNVPATQAGYWQHSLAVCHMLIDLRLPLEREREDTVLAAALCHILPECYRVENAEEFLTEQKGLNGEIPEIVNLLFRDDAAGNNPQKDYFQRVEKNPLAMLIKLADRGNLVEQLYGVSGWSARSYINETRTFFLPMCIYAKAHYPELIGPVSILMEKMRNLSEVAEILLSRYEVRENALVQEIMTLQEENAGLRRMIHTMEQE